MHKQTVKKEMQVTPAQEKLKKFFDPEEIPSRIKSMKRVFKHAAFFSELEHDPDDVTALYFHNELIEILIEMKEEDGTTN